MEPGQLRPEGDKYSHRGGGSSKTNTIYSLLLSGSLFKTTDAGTTWSLANSGLPAIGSLAIDPQNSSTLYAGAANGIFKSIDGATTWNAASSGLTLTYVRALAVDPQNSSTIYAGGRGGVFKSTDGEENWVNTGLQTEYAVNVGVLTIDPQNPRTLYAGTVSLAGIMDSLVFKSIDGGLTWITPSTFDLRSLACSWIVSTLAVDPQNPSTLYAATSDCNDQGGALRKSTDGGTTWGKPLLNVLGYASPVAVLDSQNPGVVYAATQGGGIVKSTDGGENWSAVNSRLLNYIWVGSLAVGPRNSRNLYAGTYGSGVLAITLAPDLN